MTKVIKALTDEQFINLFFISSTSSNKINKFCWISMTILSFTGLIFYTYGIYKKWNISPDIGLTIRKVSSHNIPMPAIIICDSIYPEQIQICLPVHEYIYQYGIGTKLSSLTSEEQNYLALVINTCGPHKLSHMAQNICTNRTEKNLIKLLKNAKHKTFFDICEFLEFKFVNCSKFLSRSLTDFGICDTINIQGFNELFNKDAISEDFEISKFPDPESPLFNVSIDDNFDEINWSLENGYKNNDDEVLPIRALKRNKIGAEMFFTKENARNTNMWFC